ncbi:MAG: hypothetical protein JWM64_251 [Frankiales bacterium]|nr:hypothetical protein [Frankiales bacterium]
MRRVLDDEASLRSALALPDDQPLERQDGGVWLVHGVDPADVLPVWRAARAALPTTGRWPVCVDGAEGWYAGGVEADDLVERAAAVGVGGIEIGWVNDLPETREDLELFCSSRFPRTPDLAARMVQALGDPTTEPEFDRWLFTAQQQEPALREQVDVAWLTGTGNWYEPQTVALALLPTEHGWLAPAWLSFHSCEHGDREAGLVAVQREWQQRYGAELVAHWGTMLQYVVGRPRPTRRRPTRWRGSSRRSAAPCRCTGTSWPWRSWRDTPGSCTTGRSRYSFGCSRRLTEFMQ